MAGIDFDQVRRATPKVYVYNTTRQKGIEYKPGPHDTSYRPSAHSYATGGGTENNPFRYKSAAVESAHFALIDLWCAYRPSPGKPEVYASINGMLVIFTNEGIRALDGKFTKLLPR